MISGTTFANDPAVLGKALYVSDNRFDQLFRIEPADFLNAKAEPKVTPVYKGRGISQTPFSRATSASTSAASSAPTNRAASVRWAGTTSFLGWDLA